MPNYARKEEMQTWGQRAVQMRDEEGADKVKIATNLPIEFRVDVIVNPNTVKSFFDELTKKARLTKGSAEPDAE